MPFDIQTLKAVQRAASDFATLTADRDRNMRYTFGDQWSDFIPDSFGRPVREGDYSAGSGAHPITNNLIRPLVKTIVGRYRTDHADDYSDIPGAAENDLPELDARMLEEYLISGCAIQRVHPEDRPGRKGIWVDNVCPSRFFVNPYRDPRGADVYLIGMFHRFSLHEILNRFAQGKRDAVRSITAAMGRSKPDPASGLYTIIEVWTLDSAPLLSCRDARSGCVFNLSVSESNSVRDENSRRVADGLPLIDASWHAPAHWHCRWLTTDGELLDHYPSPFLHRSHPFVFKLYPLTDGRIHPFVEDLIEQQRAINRLSTLTDHMMSTAAKGVLLFPVEAKLPDMKWEEITARWSACDGVIPVRTINGAALPQQMSSGNFNAGVAQVLDTQLELFRLTSGVSPVLTGQDTSAARGTSVYQQQVSNSVVAIADLLESFRALILRRNFLISSSGCPSPAKSDPHGSGGCRLDRPLTKNPAPSRRRHSTGKVRPSSPSQISHQKPNS